MECVELMCGKNEKTVERELLKESELKKHDVNPQGKQFAKDQGNACKNILWRYW
jgi:hypothetical protein